MPRPRVWDKKFACRIAYAVSLRGGRDDDDSDGQGQEEWLVFAGAPPEAIRSAMDWLTAGGHAAEGYELRREHAVVRRHGKVYWRLAVHIKGRNRRFASLDTLRTIIESRLRAEGHSVTYFEREEDFLNV